MSPSRSPTFWQVSFLFLSYFSVNFSESASQTSWILIGSVVGLGSITSRCSGNEPAQESSGNRAQPRPQGLLVFLPTPYWKTRRPWGRGWNRVYSGVWKPWKLSKLIEDRGSKRQHLFLSLFFSYVPAKHGDWSLVSAEFIRRCLHVQGIKPNSEPRH